MLDFQQLSQAQQIGDKLFAALDDKERFLLANFADIKTQELINEGLKHEATSLDLIRMGIILGITLGVKIDIKNNQVIQR